MRLGLGVVILLAASAPTPVVGAGDDDAAGEPLAAWGVHGTPAPRDIFRWVSEQHQSEPQPTGEPLPEGSASDFEPLDEPVEWPDQQTLLALCDINGDGMGDVLESVTPGTGASLFGLLGEGGGGPTRLDALSGADFSPLWERELELDTVWFRWFDADGDGCNDLAALEFDWLGGEGGDGWDLNLYSTKTGTKLFTARDGFGYSYVDEGSAGPLQMGTLSDSFRISWPSQTGLGVEQRGVTQVEREKVVYGPVGAVGTTHYSSELSFTRINAAGTAAPTKAVRFPDHFAQVTGDTDLTGDGTSDRLLASVERGGTVVHPRAVPQEMNSARAVAVDGKTLDVAWAWEGPEFFGRSTAVPAGSGDVLVIEFGFFPDDGFREVSTRHTFLDGATGEPTASVLWPGEHRVAIGFADVDGDGTAELLQSSSSATSSPGFEAQVEQDEILTLSRRDGSTIREIPPGLFWFYDFWFDPAWVVEQREWLLDFDGDGVPEFVSFGSDALEIVSGVTGSILWGSKEEAFLGILPVADVAGGPGWDLLLAREQRPPASPDGEQPRRASGVGVTVLDGATFLPAWETMMNDGSANTSWDVGSWGFLAESTESLTGSSAKDVVVTIGLNGCRRPSDECDEPTSDSQRSFVLDGATGAQRYPIAPLANETLPDTNSTADALAVSASDGAPRGVPGFEVALALGAGFASIWQRRRVT